MTEAKESSLRPRKGSVELWTTIAVTALGPGWENVFAGDCEGDGDGLVVTPCPAVLLQELRETSQWWDEPTGDPATGRFRRRSRSKHLQAPYDTRVVFADLDDCGGLDAACDVSNYSTTRPSVTMEEAT
jgi:hypothetical protein